MTVDEQRFIWEPGDIQWSAAKARGYDLSPRSGMISLDLPEGLIEPAPGGVTDHHITVVYLGPDVDDAAFTAACDRAAAAASAAPGPLSGVVSGLGTFPASASSDGMTPAWAGVTLPGAEQLRAALADLSGSEHKQWKPHVTLAYVAEGEPLPAPVTATPVAFTHLSVHRGEDIRRFPLGGAAPEVLEAAARLHKAGNAQTLRDWYNAGAGGGVSWGSDGDFEACVAIAGKHLSDPEGYCAERHHEVTGEWPGPKAHRGG